MIATLIASSAVLTAGAVYLRKKYTRAQYFKSDEYKVCERVLKELVRRSKNLLSRKSILSDSEKSEFLKSSATPLHFFSEKPYELPVDIECALPVVSAFACEAEKHDQEAYLNLYLNQKLDKLKCGRYVPFSEWNSVIEEFKQRVEKLRGFDKWLLPDTEATLKRYADIEHEFEAYNESYITAELKRCSRFFDSCAKYKLDEQQRRACIIDDNAGLVVAGAGSGKTSTIVAKVKYLVRKRSVDPSEILLISYTRKAAEELGHRVCKEIQDTRFKATTFHSLGLEIVKEAKDGVSPCDERLLRSSIHECLTGSKDYTVADYEALVTFVAYLASPGVGEREFDSYGEMLDQQRLCNLITMKGVVRAANKTVSFGGEKVKSLEEVLIANYLFVHEIRYVYEPDFPGGLVTSDGKTHKYKPDFYLPDYDVYIEHFAINEKGDAPEIFGRESWRYEKAYREKMQFHVSRGTKLVDSYSWWNHKNKLLPMLELKLKKQGVDVKRPEWKKIWNRICEVNRNQLDSFERLAAAFITLYKENNWSRDNLNRMMERNEDSSAEVRRLSAFVRNVVPLLDTYENKLRSRNEVDFSDMINRATAILSSSRKKRRFRYIIVDEFQDVSRSRVQLLRALIEKCGAHIFCVGDDWQSIYRFSGSDINLFVNFAENFGPYVEMKIEKTYRNSQELINVMGSFVMANGLQIKKRLISDSHESDPIFLSLYPKDKCREDGQPLALKNALDRIKRDVGEESCSVMLLGRTKYDEPSLLKSNLCHFKRKGRDEFTSPLYPNFKFRFLTVHKAKGLEDDYVIVLNAESGQMGFPNQIEDDPILQYLLSQPEATPFAEERRLFYVAITRAKRRAFIIAPEVGYSIFVEELKKFNVKKIVSAGCSDGAGIMRCPRCKTGFLLLRTSSRDGGKFYGCSHYPQCSYTHSIEAAADPPGVLPVKVAAGRVGQKNIPETGDVKRDSKSRSGRDSGGAAARGNEVEIRGLRRYGYTEDRYARIAGRGVSFVREPENVNDRNAIKVVTPRGYLMGYVGRGDALRLAPQLDLGRQFEVTLMAGTYRESWGGSCRVAIKEKIDR